jgi:hypothetical protein
LVKPEATVKENLTVQMDGSRHISRLLMHQSLPLIFPGQFLG